jgi:hypothetical protein
MHRHQPVWGTGKQHNIFLSSAQSMAEKAWQRSASLKIFRGTITPFLVSDVASLTMRGDPLDGQRSAAHLSCVLFWIILQYKQSRQLFIYTILLALQIYTPGESRS